MTQPSVSTSLYSSVARKKIAAYSFPGSQGDQVTFGNQAKCRLRFFHEKCQGKLPPAPWGGGRFLRLAGTHKQRGMSFTPTHPHKEGSTRKRKQMIRGDKYKRKIALVHRGRIQAYGTKREGGISKGCR